MHPNGYSRIPLSLEEHRFLSGLQSLLDPGTVRAFVSSSDTGFSRISCDGFATLEGTSQGRPMGVVYNDFRIRGGSFGKEPSRRLARFLDELGDRGTPVLMVLNSIGVRLMEGRSVFHDALSVLPAIERFTNRSTLYTFTPGRCLGLGALAFMMGHYR